MNAALVLARNTVLEAIREKVLYLIAGFALFAVAASRLLSPLALGEGRRVTCDLGVMGLSLSGVLIIILVGHSLVHREIERGTVAFLFSRPVGRGAFVLGKFLGLSVILAGSMASMGITLGIVLALSGYVVGAELAGALCLVLCKLVMLAAVSILFASFASPVLAGLLLLGAWTIGSTAGSLASLANMAGSGPVEGVANALLWILPRLDRFDAARVLVYRSAIPAEQWLWAVSYTGLYCVGTLLVARTVFMRRALFG